MIADVISMCRLRFVPFLLIGLLLNSVGRADRLVLTDGRTVEGEIAQESNDTVTIEIRAAGSTLFQQVRKDQIQTWYRPSKEGAPYVSLPIAGVIGEDITPEALRAGLTAARAAHPDYVILAINSPGGHIDAMDAMVDVILAESRRTKIIAYVKQAYSAAAVIAMACHEVYLTPQAAIGAVVPFRMTETGPAEVDAKFRSAFQAKIRATAVMADHADLVIRGMSELDLEIFLTQADGHPLLTIQGPGKPIKSKGQILSLTAVEAKECGLSGIAQNMNDLGTQVCGGAWHEENRRAWNAVIDTVAQANQRRRADQARAQRQTIRNAAMDRIKPECESIMDRITQLSAQCTAKRNSLTDMQKNYDASMQQIHKDYDAAMSKARTQKDRDNASTQANQSVNNLRQTMASLQTDADAAALEADALRKRLQYLMASLPPE